MIPAKWEITVKMVCPAGHPFVGDGEGLRADLPLEAPDDAQSVPAVVWFPARCPHCEAAAPRLRLITA